MTTLFDFFRRIKTPRIGYIIGLCMTLLFAASVVSNRNHSQPQSEARRDAETLAQLQSQIDFTNVKAYSAAPVGPRFVTYPQKSEALGQPAIVEKSAANVAESRRIVRTSSIDMVVQHPTDVAHQIMELTEKLGGYLVNADGGGQKAVTGSLVIRVPAEQFDEAMGEIRKLGVRVESEKFDTKDVTQEFVDQEANIRNLRAQEAQYLAILQQARTVNDMIFVSQKLTEVRGLIEKQEAEFNSTVHQSESVLIAISLRTETDPQFFGVNWHPMNELKLAAAAGLAEVVNYGMAMATILFNLPAVLLWAGTLLFLVVLGWRTVLWVRRRWAHWTAA